VTLGERQKTWRERLGISQAKFAARLGISRVALWKRETDKSIPPIGDVARIAKSYEISPNVLRALIVKALESRTRRAA
jgi:transcriptional regulator with XRE-family HTH domain